MEIFFHFIVFHSTAGFAGRNGHSLREGEVGSGLTLVYVNAFLHLLSGLSSVWSLTWYLSCSPPQMALFPLPFSLGQVSPVPWSSLLENTLSKSCVCFPTLLEHLQRPLLSLTSGLSYWLRHSSSYTSTSCRMFPETWCTDPSPSPSETANSSGSPPVSHHPSHCHPLS